MIPAIAAKRNIRAVIVEQIQLDLSMTLTVHQALVMLPAIGAQELDTVIRHAVFILPLRGLDAGQPADSLAFFFRAAFPIGFDRIPESGNTLVIGVAVLADNGLIERASFRPASR